MVGNLSGVLRQTFKGSMIILAAGLIVTYLINISYCFPFLIGSIISILNFLISATVTTKTINSNIDLKGIMLMVSFVIRILIISVIGLLLFQMKFNIVFYLIGYMSNFISLFMAIKYEERK